MKSSLKVKNVAIVVFLLLLPLYRPPYLATESFTFLDSFYVYGKIIAFSMVLVNYIFKRLFRHKIKEKKRTLETLVYLSFFVSLFVFGLLNNNMSEIGSAYLPVITIILLFLSFIDDDITLFLSPLSTLLYVYVVINLITVLLFPEGLYSSRVNEMSTRIEYSWFLGYKNPQIRLILPAISISMICDFIKYGKVRLKSIVLLFTGLITVILIKSSTGLLGIAVFFSVYFLRLKLDVKVKPKWFLIYNLAFFLLVVILRMQNAIGFFLVDILKKDTTFSGRTIIWDQALLDILRHPMLGSGATQFPIGSFFVATHPHNFILYLLLKSGLIGFVLFSISACFCAYHLEKAQDNRIAQILIMEFCAFFTMTVAESMTEAIFFWLLIIMGLYVDKICKYEGKVYDRYSYTFKSK